MSGRLSQVVSASGDVFGAAGLLAPRLLRRTYGAEVNPEAETVLRMWGVRMVQVGVIGTLVVDDAVLSRRALQLVVAANATDALAVLGSATVGAVPARTAVQIALSDAFFGTLALAALNER